VQEDSRGYVLDGFPASIAQARLLERALGGIEDVHTVHKPVPPPSLLAPPPLEEEASSESLPSGLDYYFRLSVDPEVQRRRAKGRMVDPEDESGGPAYHLEFDPPPEDDAALAARLVPVDDVQAADVLLFKRTAAYHEEAAALDAWYGRLGNVVNVEADGTVDDVWGSVGGKVQGLLDERERIEQERQEAEAAAEEARLAAEEAEAERKAEEERIAAEKAAAAAEAGEEGEEGEEEAAAEEGEGGEEGEEGAAEEEPEPTKQGLHRDMAALLLEQWGECESSFEGEVRSVMRGLRQEQRDVVNFIASTRASFVDYLARPDGKQKLVHAFQVKSKSLNIIKPQSPATTQLSRP
jgi:adenylate kinase family enzyme